MAQSQPRNEYEVKAMFIYNFSRYIQWDTADENEEFVIAVIGKTRITPFLTDFFREKKVNGKKARIVAVEQVDDLPPCHVLFIGAGMSKSLPELLERTSDQNVLTISETDGYAHNGVSINFIEQNRKIKFEINRNTLQNASLKASSHLLKLAILVE